MMKKAATIISFPLFLAIARFFPWERLPSPCVFWHITGLPCPSCGMTRSVVALTHMDLARSGSMSLLGIPLIVGLGIWWVCAVYEIATGRRTRLLAWASRRMTLLVVAGIVVLFGYGIIRIALLLRQ